MKNNHKKVQVELTNFTHIIIFNTLLIDKTGSPPVLSI